MGAFLEEQSALCLFGGVSFQDSERMSWKERLIVQEQVAFFRAEMAKASAGTATATPADRLDGM